MSSRKPLVAVVGATGTTGASITKALLASGDFRVAVIVRPSSLSKSIVSEFRASGAEIRTGDVQDGIESLKKTLEGADILVSAVVAWSINEQRDLIRAAKEVQVQRVVPCDFGTPGAKGVRALHDEKLAIHDFIKELGVPYTFIDVGWWMQLYLPLPLRSRLPLPLKEMTWKIYGDGEARNLLTSNQNIGKYVARILADMRTLNHSVIVWEDEVSQAEAHALGERLSGEGDALKKKRIVATKEDYLSAAAAAKEVLAKDPSDSGAHMIESWNEYQVSMYVLRENTLENAKRLGYLDVRELYPNITPLPFEEYAKQFYAGEDPGDAWSRA
ncbi:NAD(P)-binding protein [Dichomitus squalens]|uniref:NAD(P)-binding protein n=1 Tax=Dichomitus squalens TaxID=114155 RepID=A0A4Q9PGE3_9APHY|nr:NAD(P)-binding protein [Dichomitus squalens]